MGGGEGVQAYERFNIFLGKIFFKQSCANEFAFNIGIIMAMVWHLTGMVVREVKRPDR